MRIDVTRWSAMIVPHAVPWSVIAATRSSRRARCWSLLTVTALLVGACASPQTTPGPTSTAGSATPRPGIESGRPSSPQADPSTAIGSPSPTSSSTGFAFAAEDVVFYYETQGYTCRAQLPSTKAAGFMFRSCEKVDEAGRTRVVGVVTDPNGGLANGFASLQGKDTETFLAPTDALDPLAGFLGAMLGETQGTALLPWLAGHLGDTYAETTVAGVKVATYTPSDADHSRLYVELANQAYLDAPSPSPS